MNYASRWARLFAAVIDNIVVFGAAFLGIGVVEQVSDFQPNFMTVAGVWSLVYFVVLTGAFGATLGKMALGMKVVGADGAKVGIGAVLMREVVGKIVSAVVVLIGFVWILVDDNRQGWHDKIGKTFVVRTR